MLGLMALLGLQFNFMNIFVGLMIIGVGTDYAVYMLHRYRESPDDFPRTAPETGKAVVMAALTAIVGYGSFALSHYPGLRSIGYASFFGILFSGLAAITLLPAILILQRRKKTEMNEKATPIPAVVIERLVRGRAAADVMLVVGASPLIAIAAQMAIPLPFTPVPLTLQPLAVSSSASRSARRAARPRRCSISSKASAACPSSRRATAARSGSSDSTAGFLYSYPFAAGLAGFVSERGWGTSILRAITGMLLALGVIYLGGWSWFSAIFDARTAFAATVAPFVLADIVKVALGAALLPKAQRIISRL